MNNKNKSKQKYNNNMKREKLMKTERKMNLFVILVNEMTIQREGFFLFQFLCKSWSSHLPIVNAKRKNKINNKT